MQHIPMDLSYLIISALVSFIVTIAIMGVIHIMQPGVLVMKGGTGLFIYIGVFSANLIIEASRQRIERNRRR